MAVRQPTTPRIRAPAETVDTELGGLFYLLNVALHLGLYGDFTTPAEPGIPLDPWDCVTLLGRRLLDDPVDADPVWELLRGLAHRPRREPPGRGFDPPPDWRIAQDWLAPFEPTGAWSWSAGCGRLRLVHAAGFLVVDVARSAARPAAQLDLELDTVLGTAPRPRLRRQAQPRPAADPLRRWTAALTGYTTARLARALGRPPAESVRMLLRQRATVSTTPAHVDVTFSLSALPIEVRLAGLDRDPGWIPAAGRVVAFHFDDWDTGGNGR